MCFTGETTKICVCVHVSQMLFVHRLMQVLSADLVDSFMYPGETVTGCDDLQLLPSVAVTDWFLCCLEVLRRFL